MTLTLILPKALGLLARAEASKRRAATMMNERSSRAHSLLLLTVTQQQRQSRVSNNNNNRGGGGAVTAPGEHDTAAPIVVSQLCLADLGGSEKVKRSGASGERLHEAIFINKGLLALKSVVSTSARSKRHPGGATARHGSPRLATWPPWAWLPGCWLRDVLGMSH